MPVGISPLPSHANILEGSKSRGHGVQTDPRPQASSLKETWESLVLHFLSFLDGVGPRHERVTSMKLAQMRADAGALHRHWGAAVPGVKRDGSEVGGLGLVLFCEFVMLHERTWRPFITPTFVF